MIEFGHLAHPGTQHDCKQSTYHCNAMLGNWMVFDGIGGDGSGEFAATLARDVVARSLRQGLTPEAAIRAADVAVHGLPRDGGGHVRGTTALVLQRKGEQLQLTWVGSGVAMGIERHAGAMAPLNVDRAESPVGNRTKALGVTQSVRLPISECTVAAGDYTRLLLCSEALITALGSARVAEILSDREVSAQELADTLVFEALESEIEDSLAVIVLKLPAASCI